MDVLSDSIHTTIATINSHTDPRIAHRCRLIRHGLTEIDTLHRVHKNMQRELDAFLTSYYQRILPLYEQLEKLRHPAHFIPLPPSAYVSESAVEHASDMDEQLKSMYRRLAKMVHPDRNESHHAIYSIQQIIAAYKKGSMSTLWWMQIVETAKTFTTSASLVEYLESEWDQVVGSVKALRERRRDLEASTTWDLMERVIAAELQGIDLVGRIADTIAAKIKVFAV